MKNCKQTWVENNNLVVLFLMSFISLSLNAQKSKFLDSLVGFDYKGASMHSLHSATAEEKIFFMEWAKRQYVNKKYKIGPKILKTTLVDPIANKSKVAMPQPANCTNIDFESNNINGWIINGDYQIMSGGNDPFGGFPRVYPGSGSYSLKLNNNNIVNKTNFAALASRVINVGFNNSYLNLHFALDVLNFPHQDFQAAKFKVRFLDQNNNILACPQFEVYYAQPGGPVGINNFQQTPGSPGINIGNQSFPVTYAPWQTVGLDLTAYIGQSITMEISCDWCIYDYDWAYCYIDADCYGAFDPLGASCGTLPFPICAPTGMQSYTWTAPGIPGVASSTNCVNAVGAGVYTLQCSPYSTCGPVVLTYTFNVQPKPTASFDATVIPCTGTVNFSSNSTNNGGPPITNHKWIWGDGTPDGTGLTPSHVFAVPGPHTINLVVTAGTGCKDSTGVFKVFTVTPPVSFTLVNLTNSNLISCLTPSISYSAITNYTYGTPAFTWAGPGFSSLSPTVNLVQAGVYTITVSDPLTGCFQTQTLSISANTTAPTNSVAPLSQAVTCASNIPVTFTGTAMSPTINIQNDWYSPSNPLPLGVPIASSNNTISILSAAIPPGTYTLVTTNLFNGCFTMKTVTITSLDAWPTFSVSSPTGYSVGCSPLNQTTINIVNPQSTQTPSPATCSFTFLPPGFAGVVSPSVILGGNTSTITQTPGTWTVIVQDNSNYCRSILSVPIIQNTFAPHVAASILTQTLTCYNPTLLATGTSSTPNTIITWGIPVAPNQLSTPTVEVGPANGPNPSPTSLTYANYTVIATNTINACISTSIVVINQNFKIPISSPTISIGTPTAIYCNAYKNPAILTTGASTTTSGGGPLAYPVPYLWQGPSPQSTISGTSSYSAFVTGIYSLTIMDNFNGCLKTSTINILDKTQPPVLASDTINATLDCGANKSSLIADIIGSNNSLMYWYIVYPLGTAFSPSAAPIPNGSNPSLSGTTSQSVDVSTTGLFKYLVTNTITGCMTRGIAKVKDGDLTVDFTPDVLNGYSPLTVSFNNNSTSSLGSSSIISVWSFGNGTSQTTTSNINTTATFNAPGTYTVMLVGSKGSCLDTIYKIIKVDVPSKLEVPNVFTPNGDGSNDVFFLKTSNLGEITAIIFDRWGNKVYDVKSTTGNIAWDGKSLGGKECAEGIYFYVIKAKGIDSKEYETKGNITLMR